MPRKVTSIRLSQEELASIKEKAKACGMTTSGWCRKVSVGYTPKCLTDVNTEKQVRMVGHNLNQLTRLAHLGQLGPEAIEELAQIRASIDLLLGALW